MGTSEKRRVLLHAEEIGRIIARLAHQIVEHAEGDIALIAIRRGGEPLARRLSAEIGRIGGPAPDLGFLNINLYRDDRVTHELPESEISFDVSGRTVIVVDEVLYTGRTIRAALDAITDLGRPAALRLCVLVDRGLRELPIQADYIGRSIPTSRRERIEVRLGAEPAPDDEVTVVADAT
jgi:pyrimidine operon attenuation protein/uracil phosphoribosyltransferase